MELDARIDCELQGGLNRAVTMNTVQAFDMFEAQNTG